MARSSPPKTGAQQARRTLRLIQKQSRRAHRAASRPLRVLEDLGTDLINALTDDGPQPRSPRSLAPQRAGRVPTPTGTLITVRPTNAAGEMAIFFRQTHLSKGNAPSRAIDHQDYLERDAARDYLTVEQQQQDPAAVRQRILDAGVAAAPATPDNHQRYLEREGATDRIATSYWQPGRNLPIELAQGIAVYGSIGETLDDRKAFWAAVEDRERTPGPGFQRIYIDPEVWDALTRRPDFPPVLRTAKLLKWSADRRDPSDAGEVGEALPEPRSYEQIWRLPADTPGLADAEAWLAELPSPPTVRHEPGRGGRIQFRLIVELPHELTSDQRFAIVKQFCDETFRPRKLPFFAALHRPDLIKNDPRNWHAHIDYYDRPCDLMTTGPDAGRWDFQTFRVKANRHLARNGAEKDRDVHDRAWIPTLRAKYVEIVNRHLAAAGIAKRHTAKAYAVAGIDAQPQRPLTQAQLRIEDRCAEMRQRHLAPLTEVGLDPYAPLPDSQLNYRLVRVVQLIDAEVDLYRRRARHQAELNAEIAKPSSAAARLSRRIGRAEERLNQNQTITRNTAFRERLDADRRELADLDTRIATVRKRYDPAWQALEAEKREAAPNAAELAVLLRQLVALRRKRYNRADYPKLRARAQADALRHLAAQRAEASQGRVYLREAGLEAVRQAAIADGTINPDGTRTSPRPAPPPTQTPRAPVSTQATDRPAQSNPAEQPTPPRATSPTTQRPAPPPRPVQSAPRA